MKLALSLDVFGQGFAAQGEDPANSSLVEAALKILRDAGLRYVADLTIAAASSGASSEAWAARWHNLLRWHDLSLASARPVLGSPYEASAELAEASLQMASRLGAAAIFVDAGEDTEGAARQTAVRRLQALGDASRRLGMTLCLETKPGLCGDARGMAATLKEVNHPAVHLCFDTGEYLRLNPGASGEIALQRVLPLVAAVRLSDFHSLGDVAVAPPLGAGLGVDFARTLQILESVEFAGPVIVYFSPPASRRADNQQSLIEATRQALDESLKTLRECGWFSSAH